MTTIPSPVTIIGTPVAAYVRKVITVCEMKGVPYRLDPIMAFVGSDEFSELSPLRSIPVLIDDKQALCDSTVICEYLEERYPVPHMLPRDLRHRAQARWLQEFADTRIGDVFIWRIFYEAVVLPFIFRRPRDNEKIAAAVADQVPDVMTYLERVAPREGFLFGDLSMADLAVAIPFSNLRWGRVEPDSNRWPRTCGWVARTLATPSLAKITRLAEKLVKLPAGQHRQALTELQIPLTETTFATDRLRRGPMTPS
jgi:glutathione S-transferase